MNETIIVFSTESFEDLERYFQKTSPVNWLYLGKDVSSRENLESRLSEKFKRIDISQIYNQITKETRQEYASFVDDLNHRFGKRLEWWLDSISSRNQFQSFLFQNICYLKTYEKVIRDNKVQPNFIVVESLGLAKSLAKMAHSHGKKSRLKKTFDPRNNVLFNYILIFFRLFSVIYQLIFRKFAAFFTKKNIKSTNFEGKPLVIISTFLYPDSFNKDGDFTDRHFPFLQEYLEKNGAQVLVHPRIFGLNFNFFSIFSMSRKCKTRFIVMEDFLCFSDYISACWFPFHRLFRKVSDEFCGIDISDIFKEDQKFSSFSLGIYAMLNYRLIFRLRESGINPQRIICWYENQATDKALIAGARKVFPNAKIVGAQISIAFPNWISAYPIESETFFKMTPDVLLVPGEFSCKEIQRYTVRIQTKSAAALRYAHVFNKNLVFDYPEKEKGIMILLPFIFPEALEIMDAFWRVLDEIPNNIPIYVKRHPDYQIEDLKKAAGTEKWQERCKFFNGNLNEAIGKALIVLSGTTGAMVEAAAHGIPVIFIAKQTGMNYTPLENMKSELYKECYDSNQLICAIKYYLSVYPEKAETFRALGNEIREFYFTPVNDSSLRHFIE